MAIQINPKFRDLIPPLAPEEFAQLEANIVKDGCRDPLVIWNNGRTTLIDGHNRFEICNRLNLPFQTNPIEFSDDDEACLWIIDNAFGRRNLPIITRVELTEKRKQFVKSRQGQRTDITSVKNFTEVDSPRDQLAKRAGVSAPTYNAAKLCLEKADDETKTKLRRNQISVHRAAKDIKEKIAKDGRSKARTEKAAGAKLDARIIVGDFRKNFNAVPDGSISLIFTDPPYDRKALELIDGLGEFAAKKLADGGSLIAYVGHIQLPEALNLLSKHLRYWWTIACVHSGGKSVMREYGINAGWKPVVWFVKETRHDNSIMVSDVMSGGQEKSHHDWQQAESEAKYWIEKLCPADGLVCDPFIGGGTTAVAAKSLNRKWIGFEINLETAKIASERLAQ